MNNFVRDIASKAKRKRVLKRLIALLSAVVVLFTFNTFKMTAVTMERIASCGYPDHAHSVEAGCYDAEGNLVCGRHVHTDACFQSAPGASGAIDLADVLEDSPNDDAGRADETGSVAAAPTDSDNPTFVVGETNPVMLSDILARTGLEVDNIEEVGQVLEGDDAPMCIGVEKLENDYAIHVLESFETIELAVITLDDIVLIELKDAILNVPPRNAFSRRRPGRNGNGRADRRTCRRADC